MHFFPESISQRHGTAVCPALECPAGQVSSHVHQVALPAPLRLDPGPAIPGAALSALLTVAVVLGLVPLPMSNDTAPFRVLVPTPPCLRGATQVFSRPFRGQQAGGGPSYLDAGSVRCVL